MLAAVICMVAAMADQTTPVDHFEELDRQSTSAIARGEYGKAASLAEEALAVSRELHDKKSEARALGRAGQARLYAGDFDKARRFLEQALELDRALADRQSQVLRLNNLGTAAYFQGNYQEALERYRAAQSVLIQGPAEEWTGARGSATAANIALVYQRLGLYERALDEYRKIDPSAGAMMPKDQAVRLINLGALYRHLGDPYKALGCYRQAGDLYARNRDRDGELSARTNAGIAQALDLKDYSAALGTFDEAQALAGKAGSNWQAMQIRLYRAETLRRMGRRSAGEFEAALETARRLKMPEAEWKALFALGRVKEAAGVIESIREQAPGGALRGQFLAEKRDVYDATIEQCLLDNDAEGFLRWSERARSRVLRDQLGKAIGQEVGLAALQERLDTEALLLVYWTGPKLGGLLWATRANSGLLAREPAEVRQLLESLSTPDGGNWREYAKATGARLLGGIPPLEAGGIRRIIVVPDGLLQVVPFDVLSVPGRATLLVEEAAVTYLPTAALLAREPHRARWWRPPWNRSLVALAAPQGADPLVDFTPLPPLANATREARAIAHRLSGRTLVLTGDAAGRNALIQAAADGVPVIHVAAHAAVSEERPERSRILLEHDALFLGEVARSDMRQVDLATLSACETEQGRLVLGEGIQSFSRAFLTAGARSVVTTLWRVADEPTAAFMEAFYYHLARGSTKADALTAAKRKFLHSGGPLANPYYWAAFVLNGEGWQPAPLPISWSLIVVPAGLALFGLAWWRRRRTY